MNKQIEELKKIHNSIKIPRELPYQIQESLTGQREGKKRWIKRSIGTLSGILATCSVFIILLNTSPSFAKNMSTIPVISNIAKVLTFHEFKENTNVDVINAKIPIIQNTGNEQFEGEINSKINEKINATIETARKEAAEFKQMVEEYAEEDFKFEPIEITIDYEIKNSNEKCLSFIVTEQQSDKFHANIHLEKTMYNIDLIENKELTLKDLLGEEYQNIVNKQIKQQIEEIKKTQPSAFFEKEDFPTMEHGGYFDGIEENQKFYINESGNIVIVFDRYTISPGYRGMPEFEIEKEE